MKGIVIYHQEHGVYLGTAVGMGFWSKLDSVGQSAAIAFHDEAEARAWISTWLENNTPDDYEYVTVDVTKGHGENEIFATMEQIIAAGLPGWEMKHAQ